MTTEWKVRFEGSTDELCGTGMPHIKIIHLAGGTQSPQVLYNGIYRVMQDIEIRFRDGVAAAPTHVLDLFSEAGSNCPTITSLSREPRETPSSSPPSGTPTGSNNLELTVYNLDAYNQHIIWTINASIGAPPAKLVIIVKRQDVALTCG